MSQYRMLDRKVDRPTCIGIKVERLPDEDPDLSWLDQSDEDMGEGFEATASERKAAYGTTWETMGIQAVALYLIPVGESASTIQSLISPGLWGIESDSTPEYLTEIEDTEVEQVKLLLDTLGIDYDGIEVER
jgi:hypothetical protein